MYFRRRRTRFFWLSWPSVRSLFFAIDLPIVVEPALRISEILNGFFSEVGQISFCPLFFSSRTTTKKTFILGNVHLFTSACYQLFFLVMATKQKFVFVFLCCLLLTSIIVPANAQLARCRRACLVCLNVFRAFCRTIIRPVILRRRCFTAANAAQQACRSFCLIRK